MNPPTLDNSSQIQPTPNSRTNDLSMYNLPLFNHKTQNCGGNMQPHKWLMPSEWINFTLILFFFICGILPALWFAAFGDLPTFWLEEDGLYESGAALACLIGSIVSFVAFYYSTNKG